MTESLNPQVASLVDAYARDLARCTPSPELDARIARLVAAPLPETYRAPRHRPAGARPHSWQRWTIHWAAAAGIATLAVAAGVIIGVRVERAAAPAPDLTQTREPTWPPAGFTMWPTDSVALKIPAEFSPRGTLVAVDGNTKAGTRYWVDIVVSNDGTVRIENIVPAGEEQHAIATQTP
jgi:hypothetical protein